MTTIGHPASNRPGRAPDEMHNAFEVYENKHWALLRLRPQLIPIVRRTEAAHESAEEVRESFAGLERALTEYNRKHFSLLVDLRSAPQLFNDEAEALEYLQPRRP